MQAWWPAYVRDAWASLTEPERSRGRLVLEVLEEEYRGCVIGQDRFVRRVVAKHAMAESSVVRTIYRLEEIGVLRRRLSGGRLIVRIPEHLVDRSIPALEEDLVAARAPTDSGDNGHVAGA